MIVRLSRQYRPILTFLVIAPITAARSIMYRKDSTVRGFAGVLTLLVFLAGSSTALCPAKSDASPFKVNQITGNWYMVAATPTSGHSVSRCAQFNVTSATPNSFEIVFTAVSRRSHKPITFLAKVDTGEDNIGTWRLKGSKRLLGPFKHRIIALEERSYVVMVVCASENRDLPLHEFAVVLSPEKSLPKMTLKRLKRLLANYFDSELILDVEQNVCTYSERLEK